MTKELLRSLPKIDELLKLSECNDLINKYNRNIVTRELRDSIEVYRQKILKGEINFSPLIKDIIERSKNNIHNKYKANFIRVVNGTGVVIHTNLGRSILSDDAMNALMNVCSYYNNLEYNVESGERGSRYSHVEWVIKEITGAEDAIVVNNNAAAIMLVLNSLCEDKEVIVSRGQLVEIGGSFRIPEVMKFSRANLVEVGTTNRTHLEDYENAISENTAAFLKVHSSNFKIVGFTKEVTLKELVNLSEKNNIPIIEDIGSGVLIDLSKYGLEKEPTVMESVITGADIITFSGDKMLGGPQAGIIVGKKRYLDKIKKNQLLRALRVDKFTLVALEATFRHYLFNEEHEKIPTINMMTIDKAELNRRSRKLIRKLIPLKNIFEVKIEEGESTIGGGAMPDSKLSTYLIKISCTYLSEDILEKKLRENSIPIICRIHKKCVCIDVRTLLEDDYDIIYKALKEIGDNI